MIVALMEVQIADFEGHGAYTSVLEWYLGSLIQTLGKIFCSASFQNINQNTNQSFVLTCHFHLTDGDTQLRHRKAFYLLKNWIMYSRNFLEGSSSLYQNHWGNLAAG